MLKMDCEAEMKYNLYITDKFSIKDFNLVLNEMYLFSVQKIDANAAHEKLNDKKFNRLPFLTQEPCKRVYKNTLECELINNNETEQLLIEQGRATLCIAMDKDLNPEYYYIE